MSEKIQHLTFGCRLNLHETEIMLHHADKAGHNGDTVIVNTCTVTKEAERQARQAIRKLHRERPHAKIVVTGCASEIAPEKWETLPGVVRRIDNASKTDASHWRETVSESSAPKSAIAVPSSHTRALLQIQQGCDHDCTFCVIPQGRGKAQSFDYASLRERTRILLEQGHKEIVLTGVDIASWRENEHGLGRLCRDLLHDFEDLKRLRLSSLDPVLLDAQGGDAILWDLYENHPRMMPSVHLSLQSGSSMILKRMKRRHTPRTLLGLAERLRRARPEIALGADIIAGFPTETDEHFKEGFETLAAMRIPFKHVFPYSERPQTPAAKMPSVPKPVRQERARLIRELGEKVRSDYLQSMVGTTREILFETDGKGVSREFARFKLENDLTNGENLAGEIRSVRVTSTDGRHLFGDLI